MGDADYRKVTDALAGALDKLHERRKKVDDIQKQLSDAQAEFASAQQAAETVRAELQKHLSAVLPDPNRRP